MHFLKLDDNVKALLKQFCWFFGICWLLWIIRGILFAREFYFLWTLFFPICIILILIIYCLPSIVISYFAFLKIKNKKSRILLVSFLVALNIVLGHVFAGQVVSSSRLTGNLAFLLMLLPVYVFMLLPSIFLALLIIPKRIFPLKWPVFLTVLLTVFFVLSAYLVINFLHIGI